ncbi:hypothetical protein TNCV_1448761 [Trichonephila clavipes]|nr:hypothetical protein TNCV_1448761 [Trichonephila clavipes]
MCGLDSLLTVCSDLTCYLPDWTAGNTESFSRPVIPKVVYIDPQGVRDLKSLEITALQDKSSPTRLDNLKWIHLDEG